LQLEQLKADSIEIIKKKIAYTDSAFAIVSDSNNINFYSFFINRFPDSDSIEIAKDKRRKLFLIKEKVQESKLDIDNILKINPCYTPIYKNIDYINNKGFELSKLYNTKINPLNPYRNRYIISDLNTVNEIGESRGVIESHFEVQNSWEFKELFEFASRNQINQNLILLLTPDKIRNLKLDSESQKTLMYQLLLFQNYYRTVGQYKEEETIKKYSIHRGYRYTGQNLCFCEISNDTILLVAKLVTSARGRSRTGALDSITNEEVYTYFEAFPVGKERKYYAPHNRITSRNWERERQYTRYDAFRDSLTGGGNSRITYFDEKIQLPNFLLIKPDSKYPRARHQNGIHEGSLSNMSRCMLGTPQSLGCFRTTDYGSKFSRWWIPNNANLFIFFDEDRYTNKKISKEDINGLVLPFRNDNEGNLFRLWVNKKYPRYARSIDLEKEGSCSNCFIQLAWEKYYKEYIKSKNGGKLKFISYKETLNKSNKKKQKVLKINENKNVLSEFNITEEYYVIVGCFSKIKNANSYSKNITKRGYQVLVFFDKNANCNFVSIGPYSEKEIALSSLPSIKKQINKDAWIFPKIKQH